MKKKLFVSFGIFISFNCGLYSQNFYAIDTIQQIEITFSQSNWDYILDTAKMGSDSYTMATSVIINGTLYDSVGVKYKGNSSFDSVNLKNPLHIELDHFKIQDYFGIKDIKLSNGYHEPSSVREVLLYKMAQQYMPASNANYAEVVINGNPMGLYTNVEAVTKTFLSSRFYSDNNTFVFADNGGCNLGFMGTDSTFYYNPYTMKSDYGWQDLADLCDSLQNNITQLPNILDVDRTLWMLAFTNTTVTLDSYIGNSTHNYYIYQNHNQRFNPILWDLNGGLGIFNRPTTSTGLTTPQMQSLSPLLHINDNGWPLVKNILAVPIYKRMYIAHMRTILNENFMDSSYYFNSLYLQSIIDASVQADPNSFYTYAEFINNVTLEVVDGPKIIPGITELMESRKTFLNNTTEFQQIPPVITNVVASDTIPLINSTVFITATVTNATAVYLGTRNSIMDEFTRQLMFDDGLHGDGSAGDDVFGLEVSIQSSYLQYYIYADNTVAGIFSPERAEYEFYEINAEKGVVINELMADNQFTQADPYGEFNDWVELYNNSSSTVDLSDYYLSDDALNPTKWTFPLGTSIAANGFLIIWTDGDTTQTVGLHTNFKLSATGEAIIFTNNSLLTVDEISFPIQTPDISYGRYLNGTGSFGYMNPTHNATNSQLISVAEILTETIDLSIYPNPAKSSINLETECLETITFCIYSCTGSIVYQGELNQNQTIDLTNFPDGLFIIQTIKGSKKFIVAK